MSKFLTKIKISNLIIFTFFFIIIYFEQTNLFAGVKISHIWKILILVYVLGFVLSKYSSSHIPLLIIGFIFSLKLIFNASFPNGLISDLPDAMGFLFLPAFYYFFSKKYANKPEELRRLIYLIIFFYLVSSIPFYLGIIKSQGSQFTLSRYGFEEEQNALKGLFYHVSVSSKVFLVCSLILMINFNEYFDKKRKILGFTLLVSGILFTYHSYTRTGWFGLILGVILYFYFNNKHNFFKLLKKMIPILILLLVLIVYMFNESEAFRMRILGETTYRKFYSLNFGAISSGRLDFIPAALIGIFSDVSALVIGVGKDEAIARMDALTGIPVIAHNQIIDIWQFSGLIGLVIFIIFFLRLYKEIMRYRINSKNKTIVYMLFGLYIFFILPSHGMPIWVDMIFAGYLALIKIDFQHKNISKEILT